MLSAQGRVTKVICDYKGFGCSTFSLIMVGQLEIGQELDQLGNSKKNATK